MQVHYHPSTVQLKKPVVAIGIFDGVHQGHRNLLAKMDEIAAANGSGTLVVTFWPHPRLVLGKAGPDFKLLTNLDEKIGLLRESGTDHLLVMPFSLEFAALPAEQFLEEFLHRYINPGFIVVGDDLRFGAGGSGNVDLLIETGKKSGYSVVQMETHTANQERISSTRIRNLLLDGNLSEANNLLSYPYFITGSVVRGNRLGNTIGFPTANIEYPDTFKQIPVDGVYAVRVKWATGDAKGMLNIGKRPTIGDDLHKSIEVHLFDRTEDLYGQILTVSFIDRLRDEMRFADIDALARQLAADRINALSVLEKF